MLDVMNYTLHKVIEREKANCFVRADIFKIKDSRI